MTTALILTSLSFLLALWRARVWKRRFIKAGGITYPQAFAKGWCEARDKQKEWPDFIGQ